MASEASKNIIHKGLAPESLALFHRFLNQLELSLKVLPDKPDESATNTLSALWHAAAGQPISVQRAAVEPLPRLDQGEIERLEALLRDRLAGTPLAYLTGRQQFMGVELIATADALIPREETELLGFAALERLRAVVRERGQATVIDVCTGSGNLALALAWHEPRARVWASDLSEEAVSLARRNLALLGLADRVEFRTGDLLEPFDTTEFHGSVDLLICNPPYISSVKVNALPAEIIAHEPRIAFDGGPLGIRILLRLISEAPRFLRDGGWLAFEIGLGQGPGILKRIEQSGIYADVSEIADKSGQIRAIIAGPPLKDDVLRDAPETSDRRKYTVSVANVMMEKAGICSLWRSGLNAANLYEAKFDWYYQSNPDGVPNALFLSGNDGTQAVGVAAVGHRRMRFNGEILRTGILVDFVVRPEHRTLFPALLLQRQMRDFALQTHQIVWGLPNPKATAVFGRAGYQCIGQMVRYVRVLRSSEYLARYIPRWISRVISPIIDWSLLSAVVLRGFGAQEYIAQWQDRPDARFNDLWERSAKPDQLIGVRDDQYLTWRFVDSPFRAHSFLTIVSNLDQRLVGYAACELLHQTLFVSDFLVDANAPAVSSQLWRELAREGFRRGCTSLSTRFLGSAQVQRQLRAAGLVARDKSPLYAAVPDGMPPLLTEPQWYLTGVDLDV